MNTCHRIQRDIDNYVSDLYDRGRKTFEDLSEDEAKCLTGLLMKGMKLTSVWEHITEATRSDDMAIDLISYLISFDEGSRSNHQAREESLLHSITSNATSYARKRIDELLAERVLNEAFDCHPFLENDVRQEMIQRHRDLQLTGTHY